MTVLSCVETVREFKGVKIYNDSIPQHDLDYLIHLMKQGEEAMKEDLKQIGRGQYGTVFGYKEYAIKFARRQRYSELEESEDAGVLKHLQHLDFIPRLYATYGTEYMIVSRVRGTTVEKFLDARMSGGSPYINPKFNNAFREMLKDIVQAGWIPHDLHSKNVMIDAKTGMPMIVDVGFFDECSPRQKEQYSRNRDRIEYSMGAIRRAIGWVCDKTEQYLSADNEREMKEQRQEQVDAIHNHAEIGEMLMEAKEKHEKKPLIEFGRNGFKIGGRTAKHLSWGEHLKEAGDRYAHRNIGLEVQGMQDMIKGGVEINLDAIKQGGNVGIDFGRLKAISLARRKITPLVDIDHEFDKPDLVLHVAKNRYKHPNLEAGVILPQPMHFEMIGAGLGAPPQPPVPVFFDADAGVQPPMPLLVDGNICNAEPIRGGGFKPCFFQSEN